MSTRLKMTRRFSAPLSAITLAGLGLTALALTAAVHETRAAALAVPALTELQERIADRLNIGSISMFRHSSARLLGQGRFVVLIALGLATLLNIGALIYALVRL